VKKYESENSYFRVKNKKEKWKSFEKKTVKSGMNKGVKGRDGSEETDAVKSV
jgi:hypothetical protein